MERDIDRILGPGRRDRRPAQVVAEEADLVARFELGERRGRKRAVVALISFALVLSVCLASTFYLIGGLGQAVRAFVER